VPGARASGRTGSDARSFAAIVVFIAIYIILNGGIA
jgi:hypothetical protein